MKPHPALASTVLAAALALGAQTPAAVRPAEDLQAQVTRLQQTVARLEAQLAQLQAVVKSTPAGEVEITAPRGLRLRAGTDLDLLGGMNATLRSGMTTRVQGPVGTEVSGLALTLKSAAATYMNPGNLLRIDTGGGDTLITTKGVLQLKGSLLKLNNGTRPVATTGTVVVGGVVGAGSPTILGE